MRGALQCYNSDWGFQSSKPHGQASRNEFIKRAEQSGISHDCAGQLGMHRPSGETPAPGALTHTWPGGATLSLQPLEGADTSWALG